MKDYYVNQKDREILRELAKKQMEFARQERNEKLKKEWILHNELKGERPLIHLEAATFEHEILPQRLKCTGDFAREIETALYQNFQNQEFFDDDRVTPDYFGVTYDTEFVLFDLPTRTKETVTESGEKGLGFQYILSVEDLEDDYYKLKKSTFLLDIEGTHARKNAIEEIIGDILPVRLDGRCLYSVPTQMVVHFMGMENMMYNMFDYPELFKEMMNRISDDTLEYYHFLEEKNILLPTTSGQFVGQGSWAYNNTLPETKADGHFTTKDIWGFMDSQESVGISPEMFEEFIFPTYKKIGDVFGMLSYGCCEPIDPVWERCISKFDNLRKVSISPWCNEEYMGEQLRGSKTIFHRKPSPNYLGVGTNLDEEEFRKHIRRSILAAKGCEMEITQRDVYTINHDIAKAKRYIDIIKEEITNNW